METQLTPPNANDFDRTSMVNPENVADNTNTQLDFSNEVKSLISNAGGFEITEEQKAILGERLKDSDIYIKPDGLIYLTWTKYAERLNRAFGNMGWVMVPEGMPRIMNNLVVWGFHLVIKKNYVSTAFGEQQYFDNGRMTFGEATEGAKSNALMRLCKSLGIGLELWDKQFIDRWLSQYAEWKWDEKTRGKKIWYIKPGAFSQPTTQATAKPTTQPTPQPTPQPTSKKEEEVINPKMEPISDEGIDTELEYKLGEQFINAIMACTNMIDLSAEYNKVKIAYERKQISETIKEDIRGLANKKSVALKHDAANQSNNIPQAPQEEESQDEEKAKGKSKKGKK